MRVSFLAPVLRAAGLIKFLVGRLLSQLLAFFLGGTECLCCGRLSFLPLCPECVEKHLMGFAPPSASRCHVCGKPLLGEQGICMACRRDARLSFVDGVFSLYPYRLWRKNLLFAWKVKGERGLSPLFAAAVHKALGMLRPAAGNPVLVPVPPRPGKIRRTGWDQVDELCRLLSILYGYRVEKLLVRMSVSQQKKKSFRERRSVRGAYAASRRFTWMKRHDIIPRDVVLLDDLITSGATVAECADILKKGFVEKVNVLSLFIVD
ncbi:MAG: ComF family protein [Treponema sp.]|nr:ComF family protein [Treponema sp.]